MQRIPRREQSRMGNMEKKKAKRTRKTGKGISSQEQDKKSTNEITEKKCRSWSTKTNNER